MAIMKESRTRDVPLIVKGIESCSDRNGSVSAKFLRYQALVLVLTFLTYMCYHMTRKPISVVKSTLNPKVTPTSKEGWYPFDKGTPDDKGVRQEGKSLLGVLDTVFLFAYAFGMFFSGNVADRSNLRTFLTFSMLGVAMLTCLFGMGYFWDIHTLWYYCFVQGVAGLYQATGWPSVVSVVGKWFPHGKRGLIMGVWNSHTSVGNILGALIPAAVLGAGWGWCFVVPGLIMAGVAVVIYLALIVYPEDVGLPTAEEMAAHDEEESLIQPDKHSDDHEAIPFLRAVMIPGVIVFSMCLFFCKLVAYTFLYWLPYYIHHQTIGGRTLSDEKAANLSTLFDVGGIVGGIIAGYLSDRLRSPAIVNATMLYMAVPMLYLYHEFAKESMTVNVVLLLLTGAIVNGPYALITTAVSADLGTHEVLQGNPKALATVTAIIDGTGSIGAALGPFLAGSIKGWDNVFWMLMASAGIAAMLLTNTVIKEFKQIRGSKSKSYVVNDSSY